MNPTAILTGGWWNDTGVGDVVEVSTGGWWSSGVVPPVAVGFINPYPYVFHGRPGLK
jgi:hypothetical protein